MKRLEKEGYIKKYVAILDADKLNLGFTVFCSVKLKQMNRDIANDFVKVIKDIPQVADCFNIAGEFDYLLRINATDGRLNPIHLRNEHNKGKLRSVPLKENNQQQLRYYHSDEH